MKKYLNVLQSTKTSENYPDGTDLIYEFYIDTDNHSATTGYGYNVFFEFKATVFSGKESDTFLAVNDGMSDDSKFVYKSLASSTPNSFYWVGGNYTDYNLGVRKIKVAGRNIQDIKDLRSRDTVKISKMIFPNLKSLEVIRDEFDRLEILPIETDFSLIEDFSYLFNMEISNINTIPENLFQTAKNAKSFYNTFLKRNTLTIPENLFANCPLVTNMSGTFLQNKALTSIPENLFANNPLINNFSFCFSECSGITGKVPELWKTHPNANGKMCFYNCTNASNYSSIPTNWKT
jgi:hypothetical protein